MNLLLGERGVDHILQLLELVFYIHYPPIHVPAYVINQVRIFAKKLAWRRRFGRRSSANFLYGVLKFPHVMLNASSARSLWWSFLVSYQWL